MPELELDLEEDWKLVRPERLPQELIEPEPQDLAPEQPVRRLIQHINFPFLAGLFYRGVEQQRVRVFPFGREVHTGRAEDAVLQNLGVQTVFEGDITQDSRFMYDQIHLFATMTDEVPAAIGNTWHPRPTGFSYSNHFGFMIASPGNLRVLTPYHPEYCAPASDNDNSWVYYPRDEPLENPIIQTVSLPPQEFINGWVSFSRYRREIYRRTRVEVHSNYAANRFYFEVSLLLESAHLPFDQISLYLTEAGGAPIASTPIISRNYRRSIMNRTLRFEFPTVNFLSLDGLPNTEVGGVIPDHRGQVRVENRPVIVESDWG